jgi:DNA-binding transcriptional LysR family regulator
MANLSNAIRRNTLGDVEIRLLRVFVEIVRCNGFSSAQASLGISQASISTQMRHLEERLGVRLCERGRSGFFLTDEGKHVHSAALDLLGSIERFQGAVGDAQGELIGRLTFGTVDAMQTNTELALHRAIGDFAEKAPRVLLDIDIAAPQTLSQGLLSGRYQIILAPAQEHVSHMHAIDVFSEHQNLYCGRGSPLFDMPDDPRTDYLLAEQPFAGRSYMQEGKVCGIAFRWSAVTAHMEGTMLLLLSGAYIGFLPTHYAKQAVRDGRLRILAPGRVEFDDQFRIVYSREKSNRAAKLLAAAIVHEHRR